MRRIKFSLVALLICAFSFLIVSQVRAATEEEINTAIKNGLNWLSQQTLNDVARTGLAVLKFEDYAREIGTTPFADGYIYKHNVIKGLNYIFSQAVIIDITNQKAGDPDTNGNGKGVYWGDWESTYYTGIAMMAIAESEEPNKIVTTGPCTGWTYQKVLQDAVDYTAYAQCDPVCDASGGWSYEACDNGCCWTDNSNSGYAVLGLGYAQTAPFNCTVPAWVISELSNYCDYIQTDVPGGTDDGGSGYSSPGEWVNILKTGNLIYEMALSGDTKDSQRVKDALAYLVRHWGDNADPGWRPNHYQAMYTVMKGVESLGIFTFGDPAIDWYKDFSDAIVSQQDNGGSWSDCPCYCWQNSCNTCDKIICTEWALLVLERSVAPLIRPVVSDIPDQCAPAGQMFATINLDDYVEDGDNDDSEITWTTSGSGNISVSIDDSRVATISYPDGWTGSETITFTATDPDDQSDCCEAVFTVDPVPVLTGIEDQVAPFASFDLKTYLDGIDPAVVTWSYSGNSCLQVEIDEEGLVTITNPDDACQDPEDITFTATATVCGQEISSSDTATFTPNQPPDCSQAQADNGCLWPPNHKFVDVKIDRVTDPDGDPITITINAITSDEPTSSAKGCGGPKHAPDADGVGTDTASLRAERCGPENGRVYEISFTASDGRGGECTGTVQVKVPHDQKGHNCEAIDDGQNYDATNIN